MDTRQLTFYHLLYGKIKDSHKHYAKKILKELYECDSLNQLGILSKFANKHSKIVKASIKDLEECNLIKNASTPNSPRGEKQYVLTKHGKQLVEEDSNFF
jgi:DNA-binding HxlR family transcriptional regulator